MRVTWAAKTAFAFLFFICSAVKIVWSDKPPREGKESRQARYEAEAHPEFLLVGWTRRPSAAARLRAHREAGTELVREFRLAPIDVVRVRDKGRRAEAVKRYRARSDVRYVEPNYKLTKFVTPNDPLFGQLWGLLNTGQNGGTPGADIAVTNVWAQFGTGSTNIVVAVIDTGIDYNHPDLASNMWRNPGEIAGNGIDDDGNGIVDDVYGARWTNGNGQPTSGNPMDGDGHGTHVAGTIGAVGNNGLAVAGVNWSVRLMALKFLDDSGSGWTADAVAALDYAVAKGARLSNNSWGGGGYSQALKDAIDAAHAAGHLFVAAAGNSNRDNDTSPTYPASYDSPNIVAVAASDRNDNKASFSSFGRTSVDLAAPGVDIVSTVPGNSTDTYSGTSMATPHVAGAAALLWSIFPTATHLQIKALLLDGARRLARWEGLTLTGGRLRVTESARLGTLPASVLPVEGLSANSEASSNEVILTWTNPATASFSHVIVRRMTNDYPSSSAAGALIYSGTAQQVSDGPLPAGVRARYAIWAVHGIGTGVYESAARYAQARVGGEPDDYFTELFSAADNDLAFKSLTLIPVSGVNGYMAFTDPASNFPVNPAGGVPLSLDDDDFAAVSIGAGKSVQLYGVTYSNLFVGSNGYITFGSGDDEYTESLAAHFDRPRISMLFDDLNPETGGTVSYKQLTDRFVITFEDVREYGATGVNSFQAELFFDGRIRITWLNLAAKDGLAGISAGQGVPLNFAESNLSEYPPFDELVIKPAGPLLTAGYAGGPFEPARFVLTLTNISAATVAWSASTTAGWLALSPASGSLAGGGWQSVTASLTSVANSLSPGLYDAVLFFTNLTSGRIHVRTSLLAVARAGFACLHMADGVLKGDPVIPAAQRAGYYVERATSWSDFEGRLSTGQYALAVAIAQSGSAPSAGLTAMTAHLAAGRRAMLIDRSRSTNWAAVFEAGFQGFDNQPRVQILEPDLAVGLPNPLSLANPGYGRYAWGLTALGEAESLARFPAGHDAVVWGNNRRSAIVGFAVDALPYSQGVTFFENLIRLLEGGGDALSVVPAGHWEATGFELGPFAPSSRLYAVRNVGTSAVLWTATPASNWIALASTGGLLLPGQTNIVPAWITAAAATLPTGLYWQAIVFSNVTSGAIVKRWARLDILPLPGEIAVSDSVTPTNDLYVPFGEVIVGKSRTEQVIIRNIHPLYALRIDAVGIEAAPHSNFAARVGGPAAVPLRTQDLSLPHHPSRLIVGFKDGVEAAQRDELHAEIGAARLRRYRQIPADVVEIGKGQSLAASLKAYAADERVAYVEPVYRLTKFDLPNDPLFDQLWGLRNTGQTGGTPGADIGAATAWSIFKGSTGTVVAVIDTGIDYSHPDLSANMWVNPGEIPGNGLDDDGNGIVDDLYGARWTDGTGNPTSNDPYDDESHGTHVAGTIGAVGNNAYGVVGVNWRVRLMALKFLNAQGSGFTADAVAALEYALEKGARISNNSWGGGGYSQALRDLIETAAASGHLFVAAAGNSGTDNDLVPQYPAAYPSPNIVAVASSDHNDNRSPFSNYGRTTVHLAAPGSSILSTVPGNDFANFSGTSMATPHVAGAAALLLGLFPAAGYADIKTILLNTVDVLPAWADYVASGGRLNAGRALQSLNPHFRIGDLPSLPTTIPPGGTLTIDVSYRPISVGTHTARLFIVSNDPNSPTTRVALSGVAVPDALVVEPQSAVEFEGNPGGPFYPSVAPYRLTNQGASAVTWTAVVSAAWLNVVPAGGSLPVGSQTTVAVSIASAANSLPLGRYTGTVDFINVDAASTNRRLVYLRVERRLCDAVDLCEWSWSTGGSAPWFSQTNVTFDGVDAAASGTIDHNQLSWIQTVVVGPGLLSFYWRVSSEANFDFLQFQRNGSLVAQISGEVGWELRRYELPSGVHTLRWSYVKDESVNTGSDRGWLDQVRFDRYLYGNASDHAGNYGPPPSNFVNGANGGRGFLPWQISLEGSSVADLFDSTTGSGNINSPNGFAWRFYGGTNGAYVNAVRPFGSPLRSGDVFRVTIAYNWNGGARGVSVLTFDDYELFNVNFGPGDVLSFKWGNTASTNLSTYWSPTTILHVAATQLESNRLRVTLLRNDGYTTNLVSSPQPNPAAKVKFYNGGHPANNVRYALFANNLSIARSNAHDADGDGLPDWWETEYFGDVTNASPFAWAAEGSYTVWEAWVADLNPNDPNARFPRSGLSGSVPPALSVTIEPTSTARLYGVEWTTNLSIPQWTWQPPMQTGTGAAVTFPVTNPGPWRMYRTFIRQP